MSALPDFDEIERLPCLTTRTPQAAASSPAPVEMLKLPEPSPPVPTVSTVGVPSGIDGLHGELAHCRRESTHFVRRLALGTHAGQERARERRAEITGRKLLHQVIGLLLGQRLLPSSSPSSMALSSLLMLWSSA